MLLFYIEKLFVCLLLLNPFLKKLINHISYFSFRVLCSLYPTNTDNPIGFSKVYSKTPYYRYLKDFLS